MTALAFFQVAIVALVALACSFYTRYYDWTHCREDPPIHLDIDFLGRKGSHLFSESCSLYSSEYVEAKEKFRDAVQAVNTTEENVELWSFPVLKHNDELTIDIGILHGNTNEFGTIVHSSGTHGVEGYAGSAIQLAFLEILKSESSSSALSLSDPKKRPTIVFVHAVNPVGMQEYRRCNENNVDLNRNAIILSDTVRSFREFVENRDPNIAGYDDFRDVFVPTIRVDERNFSEGLPSLSFYEIAFGYYVRAIPALWRHGFAKLKQTMVGGQYHHPEGLTYGGQNHQTSVQTLVRFFERDRPEFLRDAPSVVWIDVHTGLGPFGKDTIMYYPRFTNGAVAGRHPRDLFSTAYIVSSEEEWLDSATFQGYDNTNGLVTEYFAEAFLKKSENRRAKGLFMMQEFGTLPGVLVGRALVLDNLLYQLFQTYARTVPYRSPFLKFAFFPQSKEWRSMVIQRGIHLLLQSIEFNRDTQQE